MELGRDPDLRQLDAPLALAQVTLVHWLLVVPRHVLASFHVMKHDVTAAKAHLAGGARKGLLACMAAQMPLQVLLSRKAHQTLGHWT